MTQKDVDLAPNKQFDSFVLPDYTMTHSFDNNSKVDADEIMSGVVNKSAQIRKTISITITTTTQS